MLVDLINTNVMINTWYHESKIHNNLLKRNIAEFKRNQLDKTASKYANLQYYSAEDLTGIFRYCYQSKCDNELGFVPPYINEVKVIPIGSDGQQIVANLGYVEETYKYEFTIHITLLGDFIDLNIDIDSISPNGNTIKEHLSRRENTDPNQEEGYMRLTLRGLNSMLNRIVAYCTDRIFFTYKQALIEGDRAKYWRKDK